MSAHKIYVGLHRKSSGRQNAIAVQRLLAWQSGGLHQSQPFFNAAGIISVAVVVNHPLAPRQPERWILAARQNGRIFQRYMALVVVAVQRPGLQLPARELALMHQQMKRVLVVITLFANCMKSGDEFTLWQHLFFCRAANRDVSGRVHSSSSIPS